MLPYTPLHHLLLETLNFPIIATSGNLASEPLCTDEREALDRLSAIADFFLVHDRPITHPVDDSVVRVIAGTPVMLRRARGYAPLPIELLTSAPSVIATGAHLKNTVALSVGQQAFVSQHIGDLEASETLTAFERTLSDLQMLYQQPADQLGAVACDLHPDYRSTQAAHMIATQARKPLIRIQHHYAHVLACMTEHHLTAPALGVVWDGTGYGTDGTIWGGEFLRITDDSFERAAYLRPFRLAGGDQAVREPRRSALGLLHTMYGEQLTALPQLGFSRPELAILKQTLAKRINAPLCSSMGRFFDAAAALLGLRQRVSFEGQAAMELEFACGDSATETSYPFNFTSPSIDWTPIIEHVLSDLRTGIATNEIAARFHNTLTEIIMAVAVRCQLENVVLTGGCFQNKRLLEKSVQSLQEAGFRPHWSQQFPPNDGSIALGQIAAAVRATQAPPQEKTSCV
jgi:hydrogenase maturation protein HypF